MTAARGRRCWLFSLLLQQHVCWLKSLSSLLLNERRHRCSRVRASPQIFVASQQAKRQRFAVQFSHILLAADLSLLVGQLECPFATLFDDDECQQTLESLMGTLKASKKRGIITFEGQLLLKGSHDKVRNLHLAAEPFRFCAFA